MTCCINYDYEIFERFIGSLFDCTDNIDLVIFIGENDVEHILKLKKIYENIIYFVIDNKNNVCLHIMVYYHSMDRVTNAVRRAHIAFRAIVAFQRKLFAVLVR